MMLQVEYEIKILKMVIRRHLKPFTPSKWETSLNTGMIAMALGEHVYFVTLLDFQQRSVEFWCQFQQLLFIVSGNF